MTHSCHLGNCKGRRFKSDHALNIHKARMHARTDEELNERGETLELQPVRASSTRSKRVTVTAHKNCHASLEEVQAFQEILSTFDSLSPAGKVWIRAKLLESL